MENLIENLKKQVTILSAVYDTTLTEEARIKGGDGKTSNKFKADIKRLCNAVVVYDYDEGEQ